MLSTTSWLCPKIKRHQRVNDFSSSILENNWAVWQLLSIIVQSAAYLGKNASDIIVAMFQNKRQRSVNGVSTIFHLASSILYGQWNTANWQSTYRQPLSSKLQLTILHLPPTIERPRSVNNFGGGSASYTAMKYITLFLNGIACSQSLQSVLLYNVTNMYAMSHRSDFFTCSSRFNI